MPEISDAEYAELQQLRAGQQTAQPADPPPSSARPADGTPAPQPTDPPDGGEGADLDASLSLDELRDLPDRIAARVASTLEGIVRPPGASDPAPDSQPTGGDPPPPDDTPTGGQPDDPDGGTPPTTGEPTPESEPTPRPPGRLARAWFGASPLDA